MFGTSGTAVSQDDLSNVYSRLSIPAVFTSG